MLNFMQVQSTAILLENNALMNIKVKYRLYVSLLDMRERKKTLHNSEFVSL